jgi:hypothetical protein
MKTTRVHYQHGSIRREARKHSPAVWVFRWREDTPTGRIKRKEIIGTVEKYKTKASAIKACESLRSNINRETRVPRTFGELVAHYRENELPRNKTPYTVEVYEGYLKTWLLPEWKEHRLSNIPQGSPQNRPTVVTSKPANESGLGLGCFTPPAPAEASLFSCANSEDRI